MGDFDPGPGWVNVQFEDEVPIGTVAFREDDGSWSYWVREVPVPPLPTEPGWYVAQAPVYNGGAIVVELLNSPKGQWVDSGDRSYLEPEEIVKLGPLIRLEPRAVTAKAVVNRVTRFVALDEEQWATWNAKEAELRAEFGVTNE